MRVIVPTKRRAVGDDAAHRVVHRRQHRDRRLRRIDAEVLDGDPFDPQVGSPHLLDELCVVAALDVDAARQRNPCPGVPDGVRSRCRARARPGRPGGLRSQHDRSTIEQKAGTERERPTGATPVLQHHHAEILLNDHDLADESGRRILHDHAALGYDLDRTSTRRLAPVS